MIRTLKPGNTDREGLVRPVLKATGIRHRFGSTTALSGVSLEVAAGECVALLGPNGAGKTTLVRSIVGLISPDSGSISAAGGDPTDHAVRTKLGVVQQGVGFPKTLTVLDIVRGAADRAGASRDSASGALAEMGLNGLEGRRAASLSGGQQQRLQLAMGLVSDPILLVLDEPTTGLDIEARARFWSSIRSRRDQGTGVLLTTHMVEEAGAVADRVVVIDQGSVVVEGTPAELKRTLPDRWIEAATDLDVEILRSLAGVNSVQRRASVVRVSATEVESVVAWMLEHDPRLRDLTITTASLDDVLMRVTTGRVA